MSNPFDDADASFHVLVNLEGQHSLWPVAIAVPDGWSVVLRDCGKDECVSYVDAAWTDMRPRGLAAAMDSRVAAEQERQ